jgi:hypothetical protein
MARWSASANYFTPTAVANTTNFTDSGYLALQGGSSTQRSNILEVYMGGLATSSAPCNMIVARDATVGATLSGGFLAALDPASAALAAPPVQFTISTTKPGRSSTAYLLQPAFNAFGGVVRWVAAPGEEIGMLGNTASNGEISLSHGTSGTPGLMSAHFIFEPF